MIRFNWLGYGPVAGSLKHTHKKYGAIKDRKYIHQVGDYQLLKEY